MCDFNSFYGSNPIGKLGYCSGKTINVYSKILRIVFLFGIYISVHQNTLWKNNDSICYPPKKHVFMIKIMILLLVNLKNMLLEGKINNLQIGPNK